MTPTMSLTVARRNFGNLLNRVERGERIVITRYGKPFAAVIPIPDLQSLTRTKAKSQRNAWQ